MSDVGAALDACRERGFVVLDGLVLTAAALESWMTRLGRPMFTPGEMPLVGTHHVFEVSNRGRPTPPRSVFHSDTSYVTRPPSFTALAAVEIPEAGGETIFINQFDALDSASASLRRSLVGVEFLHVASRVANPDEAGEGAWHPVLRRHPDTGRDALYVSARERLTDARRNGASLTADEARELIDAAHEQAMTGAAVERHRWRPDDLLLTDNRSTLHAADHSAVRGTRTLHRVMVEGEVPVAAPRLDSPQPLRSCT